MVAKWVSAAKEAERESQQGVTENETNDTVPDVPHRLPAWLKMTLEVLFGNAEMPRARRPSRQAKDEEEIMMQALADAAKDANADDGAI